MDEDEQRAARRSRRWAIGVAVWLLALSIVWFALRLAVPSDDLAVQPPTGAPSSGVIVVPLRPVAGIAAGDRLEAVNGRPVAEILGMPRPRPVRAGERLAYQVAGDGGRRTVTVTVRPGPSVVGLLPRLTDAGNVLTFLSVLGLGVWLVERRPHDRSAHALLLLGASLSATALPPPLLEPLDLWARPLLVAGALAGLGAYMVMGVSTLLFACSFPEPGRAFARRPWAAAAAAPVVGLVAVGAAFAAGLGSVRLFDLTGVVAERVWEASTGAGLVVVAVRWYRLRHDPLASRRLGLVGVGYASTFGLAFVGKFVPVPLPNASYFVVVALFPLAVGVAIVKDDLFELNVVLDRALVAAMSGAALLALYLGAVGLTAALTGGRGPLVALPAAGLVAVAFAPLRAAVRRFIGHRLFGTGSDPRLVFHRLGTRLAASDDPESLMAAVVDTATESLRLPYAAVELRTGDGWATVEQRGSRPEGTESFEMISGDAAVGRLVVAPRRDVKVLSPSDRQLLEDLASHSVVAARVTALLTDLRVARQRLLVAREAERDRIHRDLHDGVGPSLVGLTLQLEVAAELGEGTEIGRILSRLHADAARATEDVRRLVRDLRPADLDELGLPAAVAAAAARLGHPGGPRLNLETPTRLPDLGREVEDAAYKICLEAMANAVRHSGARSCAVRLGPSGESVLAIEIADDGRGMTGEGRPGTGLRSMQERAEAVGGWLRVESRPGAGTRIEAELPATAP